MLQPLQSATRPPDRISTVGERSMTAQSAPWQTAHIVPTAIQTNTQKRRSSWSGIMRRRNPHAGLVVFWVKLHQRGYTRSISGLHKLLRRIDGKPVKLPNPKYIPKPYEKMEYPGQRGQIDVKYVPAACLVGEAAREKYYQYTSSTNTVAFAILKHSRSRVHTLPHSF